MANRHAVICKKTFRVYNVVSWEREKSNWKVPEGFYTVESDTADLYDLHDVASNSFKPHCELKDYPRFLPEIPNAKGEK
jgi:hypothetical protein